MILAVVVVFVVGILMGFPLVLTLIGATVAPGLIDPDFAGNIQFVLRSIIGGGDSTSILAAPCSSSPASSWQRAAFRKKSSMSLPICWDMFPVGSPVPSSLPACSMVRSPVPGTATCAAVGAMTIPVLLSLGYDKEFSGCGGSYRRRSGCHHPAQYSLYYVWNGHWSLHRQAVHRRHCPRNSDRRLPDGLCGILLYPKR